MTTPRPHKLGLVLFFAFLLMGCEQIGLTSKQSNAIGNRPDLDCIIANDFYVVHFSTYVQPVAGLEPADAKAAFVPYCQQIPRTGKMFFTADLIDRDIRATPIGIRLVEVEKTGKPAPDDLRELRTLIEIPAKLYPRGAVEAQADIDSKGIYVLYLLIGDAIEADDRFRIALEVGVDPNAVPVGTFVIAAMITLLVAGLIVLAVIRLRARKADAGSSGQRF